MKTRASLSTTTRCLCAGIVMTALLTVAVLVEAPARAAVPSIFDPTPFDTTDGRQIYEHICQGCHMPNAGGAVGAGHYPALAGDPTLVSRQFMALTLLNGRRNMPAFGAKQDAIPGFIRDLWFKAEKTGTFRSQCVELCGKEHGFMPIVVKVVTQEEYGKWVGDRMKLIAAAADDPTKQYALEELKKRGGEVYAKNCVACHQPTGKGLPPA